MESISLHTRRLIYISILLFPYVLSVNTQTPSPSPSPQVLNFSDQRLATVYPIIQAFKNIITSDPLNITKTWVGPSVCNYTGFYCDNPPDNSSAIALAGIDFNGLQLTAPTLDGFIDQLPDLAIFHANSNNFSGTISSKIAKLPFFYELDISNNRFSGNFPTEILGITGLSFLDIRYNFFTGSVPPQVFTQSLDFLFLNNNNFMQKLPETLGSTTARYLTLANNKFTGPIPRSIVKACSTLTEILLLNNLLTGCLPYELGFLSELVLFDAGNNQLTGPLPCSLGCLANIEQINLAGNMLFGQVPEVLCQLGKLANLSLSGNYFSILGPQCRVLVESGVLDIRKNCIPDLPHQRSVYECAAFFMHPRYCPYPASFNRFPCKFPSHNRRRVGPRRNLVSYGALSRHRARYNNF